MRLSACICLLLFASLGCDSLSSGEFEPEYVVEAYLEAGKPLSSVRVSQTISVGETYTVEEVAVFDAEVRVHLLDEGGAVESIYRYGRSREVGVFQPADATAEVLPLRTYELIVEIPNVPHVITSRTTVPADLRVVYTNADTVVFQTQPQFTFHLSRPFYPGRQSIFVLSTFSTGDVDQLTPFARGLFDTGDVTLQDLRQRASPILNEENFEHLPNGELRVEFPWLAVYFFGSNEVRVQAVDENLHDFLRSQMVQQGGSTLPPGEIPNVLEHVEGGNGVFGSYSSASAVVFVERNDGL